MNKKMIRMSALFLIGLMLFSCSKKDNALDDLTLTFSYYVGDNLTPYAGSNVTAKSDRNIAANFSNYNSDIEMIEVTVTVNGTATTCKLVDKDNNIKYEYYDWPATNTEYSFRVRDKNNNTKLFGPYTVNIDAAGDVVSGSVSMGNQGYDINGYGCFFQSRHVGWGGGWVYANWTSLLAESNPRILDFATLTISSQLQAISPDEIKAQSLFTRLTNDCGFRKTTFGAYTGSADPETAALTAGEIAALPEPAAGNTSINLSEGTRFVFKTEEGKKGLIKIKNIVTSGSDTKFTIFYSCEQ